MAKKLNVMRKHIMKDNPLVSVVMPVYNTSQYLQKSIGSILLQKYQNIELLCINDGSTDNSLDILKKYALLDNRVNVIDKHNEGVSKARNIGIEKANGEYICFIDSDDAMPENAIQAMVDTLKLNPTAKYVKGNNLVTTSDGNTVVTKWAIPRKPYSNKLLTSADFWHHIDMIRPCVWGILFDLSHIRNSHLQFNTDIDFGEDALFLAQYIDDIPGVYIDEPTYDYLFGRQGSLCNLTVKRSKEFYDNKIRGGLTTTKLFYELSQQSSDPFRKNNMNEYINWFGSITLSHIVKSNRFRRLGALKALKNYCPMFKTDNGGRMHKYMLGIYNKCYYLLNIIP